ncbi:NAD(P)/FAD-dependent oxidoreductase [soil metagenome]
MKITRRDFLDGIRIATGAALLAGCHDPKPPDPTLASGSGSAVPDPPPFEPERDPSYYPPALTGLRGSHVGSFEVAHQLVAGTLWKTIAAPRETGEHYDLVVVGGGISGLSAAHFYRKLYGEAAKILVLDNHDDVGGHAKRNEVTVGGHVQASAGGSFELTATSLYSAAARALIGELGVDETRFARAFPASPPRHGMGTGIFFDKETFGKDLLVKGEVDPLADAVLAKAPISAAVRADLTRLYRSPPDYWPGIEAREKQARLSRMSYRAFLLDVAKVSPEVLPWFQTSTHDLYGVGIDAVPALDCWGIGLPGFTGLKLGHKPLARIGRTPAMLLAGGSPALHFPDGNASIARLLVRRLVPDALPGSSIEDVVTARLNYAVLDDAHHATRIRLNSTVVRTRHVGDPATAQEVEITYVRGGRALTVRANACVLACWHVIIPHLAPELPAAQRAALADQVKVPLLYTNVSIQNWRALDALGVSEASAPGSFYSLCSLELPIDAGKALPHKPEDPAVLKLIRTPCQPGVKAHDQHRQGRIELLSTPFETLEQHARDQLQRMFGAAGFDAARDITAVIVNRWSHGYSYEYNSLWDKDVPKGEEPCVAARQKFGRITIANADAGAYAYVDGAIEQAFRAINELG